MKKRLEWEVFVLWFESTDFAHDGFGGPALQFPYTSDKKAGMGYTVCIGNVKWVGCWVQNNLGMDVKQISYFGRAGIRLRRRETHLEHIPYFVLTHPQLLLTHTLRFHPFQLRTPLLRPPHQRVIFLQFLLSTINHRP